MNKIERDVVEYLRRLPGFNYTAKLTEEHTVSGGWEHDAWDVRLSRNGRIAAFPYRTGLGHRKDGEPTTPHIAGVLDSLLSDAEGCDAHFFAWADSFGLSRDSREALDTYLQCGDVAEKLNEIFSNSEQVELAHMLRDY